MTPIGGYFELELRKDGEYHKEAIKLNSGRNALEYILRIKGYKKVYLPFYTCKVMLEPISKLKLNYEFYSINEQLEPMFNFNSIGKYETFIYTNYFGIKGQFIKKISNICTNLIIDNSQAFFEKPIKGIDTFYSPRKFLGVSDGAYLYTNKYLKKKLEFDKSYERFSHLIKRIDDGAEEGYRDFKTNDSGIDNQPIKSMSKLTQAILGNIDYNNIIRTRINNFQFLNKYLKQINNINIPECLDFVPMNYPLLIESSGLKNHLINNKIFLPTYWTNVLEWCTQDQFEYKIAKNILCLPIDQRYNETDMLKMLNVIKSYQIWRK